MRYFLFVLVAFPFIITAQEGRGKISGKVINRETGEPLANCNITIEAEPTRTITDHSGKFSIQLSYGTHKITFSFIGFSSTTKEILISPNKEEQYLIIGLVPISIIENEILVQGKRNTINTVVQEISAKNLTNIPNMYSDILRSVQILSGVSSNNELSSGYNVHGGTFEENLIYLNGYEIFRPFLLR
jgi:hypothetical protein